MAIRLNKKYPEITIKDTHRGLLYEDGRLIRVLEAGRFSVPKAQLRDFFKRTPEMEVTLVDMRERDLTIKGQEILTADKVAIRVSILVQFRVIDATTAIHAVENYEERLYSDVQLAARRSLAAMDLEEILTNRNRLSEEILAEVQDSADGYGVTIRRADVKDLIFPGNLQEIMNRVLAAERNSEAQLVEARTRAEVERIDSQMRAETQLDEAKASAQADKLRLAAKVEAAEARGKMEAELYEQRESTGRILEQNPSLLRLEELKVLSQLGQNGNARIYLGDVLQSGIKD
jgi:regulator of protease activity HflC (stomatin/prohibitin superfamily)